MANYVAPGGRATRRKLQMGQDALLTRCPVCRAGVGQPCPDSHIHTARWIKAFDGSPALVRMFVKHEFRACPFCTTDKELVGAGSSKTVARHMIEYHRDVRRTFIDQAEEQVHELDVI